MTRYLIAPILWLMFALPAAAQQIPLGELSRYLNNLQTATGEFTQVNADGTLSTGTIYIKRPGRVRFEYNPPEQSLVMASAGTVAVFDRKSNAGPEQYPLAQTPLKIILERNVDLARAGMVTGHSTDGTATTVRAQDPQRPELGHIEMKFTGNPTELRQWVITDQSGLQTTIILGDLTKGVAIADSQFNIQREINR